MVYIIVHYTSGDTQQRDRMVGGELTDFIIVIRNSDAFKTFGGKAYLSVGAGASAAAGIIGRAAESDFWPGDGGYAACYTYSCSKGSMVTTRTQENCRYYGNPSIKTSNILLGSLPRHPAAKILYDALSELYMKVVEHTDMMSKELMKLDYSYVCLVTFNLNSSGLKRHIDLSASAQPATFFPTCTRRADFSMIHDLTILDKVRGSKAVIIRYETLSLSTHAQLRSEILLPIMKELVPHYLQNSGKVTYKSLVKRGNGSKPQDQTNINA
nr:hypothetical protein [Tanacetum cinerariifolium]